MLIQLLQTVQQSETVGTREVLVYYLHMALKVVLAFEFHVADGAHKLAFPMIFQMLLHARCGEETLQALGAVERHAFWVGISHVLVVGTFHPKH